MITVLALLSQLSLADSLYAHGYYETARIEYMRTFFCYPELKQELGPRLRYAFSLLNMDEAIGVQELETIIDEHPNMSDSIKVEIAYKYIQMKRYYLAIKLLRDTNDKALLGMVFLLDDQIFNARNTFIESGDYEIAGRIDRFINEPKKSAKTAALLSLFLPGAGQIYAGDYRRGFMDFTLNLGSAYLLYNAVRQHKYVDAGLVFAFLLHRFYLGSLYNAQVSAIQHNEKKHHEWLKVMLKKYFSDIEIE